MQNKRIVGVIVFSLLMVLALSACNTTQKGEDLPVPSSDIGEDAKNSQFIGVVKHIDESKKQITFFNTQADQEVLYEYTGGTTYYNKYDKAMAIGQLDIGEMVEVDYNNTTQKVIKMKVSEEAWEYKGVGNLKVDASTHSMKIADVKYRYTDKVVVSSQGQLIDLMGLNVVDELTVKGVGSSIHSIIVTTGHGYIRPSNYEAFLGGLISIGYGVVKPITQDMLIATREGAYNVTMTNGDFTGTKNVFIDRDQETVLDMIEFRVQPDNMGQVDFQITPVGADLYINGILTDYTKEVALNYGEHNLRVTITGYTEYIGVLDVNSANPSILINLVDEVAEVADKSSTETDNTTDTVTSVNESEESTKTETIVYDQDHLIKVTEPIGAAVYINDTYKGLVPCSFTKQIGTQTITLSQDSLVTKSYTVEIIDDAQDISWSFPAMVVSSE